MIKKESRNVMRKARHTRIRSKIEGTTEVPRLSVFRSNQNISVQIIDDSKGVTLVSASTLEKDLKVTGNNSEACKIIGEEIAKRALKANIKKVVFDRSGYLYHGRIKVLAEAARAAGLEF